MALQVLHLDGLAYGNDWQTKQRRDPKQSLTGRFERGQMTCDCV
jgi:hypothetical protein